MKNVVLLLVIIAAFEVFSCSKSSTQSDKFKLLTTPTWQSDSLLVNGVDAGGTGGLLKQFKGDMKFNSDYTGTFATFSGTWKFELNETEIMITSDSLPLPVIAVIAELTQTSLKLTTSYPPSYNIRMTFKAK